ncbi:MAG: hypothetical protein JXB88_19940 [Spirochaetales bacterium]|nr:hypothetical protein [Spirochaetales bacterium]
MKCNEKKFNGHRSVEIVTDSIQLVITTDFGPRIVFWGRPDKENLLVWAPGKFTRGEWDLLGGHRVWSTRPLADECEETYRIDDLSCEVQRIDSGWIITAPCDSYNNTRRGIGVRVLGDNKVEIDNFLINTGDMLYSGGVWSVTSTLPDKTTQYGIPLGDGSMWDYCKIVMFRRWDEHFGSFNDDQFSFTHDMMMVNPGGKENKRCVQADRGIIAMHDPARKVLFAKKAGYDRHGIYPYGCNLAVYIAPGNEMVEMETMGPERMLKPGESLHNKEVWVLESSDTGLDSKKLISLFNKDG